MIQYAPEDAPPEGALLRAARQEAAGDTNDNPLGGGGEGDGGEGSGDGGGGDGGGGGGGGIDGVGKSVNVRLAPP